MARGQGKLPQKMSATLPLPLIGANRARRAQLKSANDQEISVARVWPVLFWTLGLGAALAAPAAGQNLDAGKPPSQIFAEACAGCHKSARDFKNGVSASFLREHYTTGADMASTMAAYLTGVRTEPPRSSPPPKPSGTAAAREATPTDTPRGRPQQASEPKAPPTRTRPGTARTEATKSAAATETKPPAPPAPPPPPVEEFEE
jgi:mono/diheme cytochrome c family protein